MRLTPYALIFLITGNCLATNPISSIPYNITQSGEYYFTNQIVAGNAKITISSSNVLLDLQGHTLDVSAIDEAVLVGLPGQPAYNEPPTVFQPQERIFGVVIQNGTIVNHAAGCFLFQFAANCTLRNILAVSNTECTFYDLHGAGNHIVDCTFASGKTFGPPAGSHGPGMTTITLEGCSDLFENNRIGGSITTNESGAAGSFLGNVIRNNVLWNGSIVTTQYDVIDGNLFAPKLSNTPGVGG